MTPLEVPTMGTYQLELVPAYPLGPMVVPGTPAFELAVVHAPRSWLSSDETVLNIRGLVVAYSVAGALRGIAEQVVNFEAALDSGESRAWGTARFALDRIGDLRTQWAGSLASGAMWGCVDSKRMIGAYTLQRGASAPLGPIDLAVSLAGW
jgi:hypothetical protein